MSPADLRGRTLTTEDLVGLDLRNAQLQVPYSPAVALPGADLTGTDLSAADLVGANLAGAVLDRVQARGTNLQQACLRGTSWRSAEVVGADLTGANVTGALLAGTDVATAKLWPAATRMAWRASLNNSYRGPTNYRLVTCTFPPGPRSERSELHSNLSFRPTRRREVLAHAPETLGRGPDRTAQ
jgi:hypothetical protein